ncbi:MAG: hypothetical protein K0B07_05815 [DPANN group archaeon]|nr:hypothetical protein [DPANN group archaeon]
MKLFLILIFLTITSHAEDKIVNIKLSSLNTKSIYEKIEENKYYHVVITNDNKKFYMKNNSLQGTKTTMKISKGNMINEKLVKQEEVKDYFIYDLKCIKINDVYFNCIE